LSKGMEGVPGVHDATIARNRPKRVVWRTV
jgi:hypothetical protein